MIIDQWHEELGVCCSWFRVTIVVGRHGKGGKN